MKCFIGVDLGSTTTKALVLDENGELLGRGITNSRSNYDLACEVAKEEALLDARFGLFERAFDSDEYATSDAGKQFLASLRRSLRQEQHLSSLAALEENCRVHARDVADSKEVTTALDRIFLGLRQDAENLFGPSSDLRSDFFRDIAGSRFMAIAEWLAKNGNVSYELLCGLFDKAIIAVESTHSGESTHGTIVRALDRMKPDSSARDDLMERLRQTIERVLAVNFVQASVVGTGYGRARLPFRKECIRSEILCHGMGAHSMFPGTRTVLDIGGQDTKAIQIDADGVVERFQMNDRCAAGCGRYLGYIADEMNIGVQDLGPMAMESTRPVRISSTCTVFAGAELRDRLSGGEKRADILAGLHRAIILRAMSLLARSGGVFDEFTFTGGVARNPAAVSALKDLVAENYGSITTNISPTSIYTGALGAALFALREERSGAPLTVAGESA